MFKSVFKTGIRASYNVSENPLFITEPWTVYPAKHKTTGRQVSVFIFDKSKFESSIYKLCQRTSNTRNPKVIIGETYELLKFEVAQLSKLRHPQVLTILEVLEETKSKFLFVSEQIQDTLVTVNISQNLDEHMIQKGLLQIAKATQFLHSKCSIIHSNLQPSSIYITTSGDWKLSGFRFLKNLNEISPQERENFFIINNSSVVPFSNLNYNFTAPELLIDPNSHLDYANDIWSFGCLIYYVYNNGESLVNCFDMNSISDYKSEFNKFANKFYDHRASDLRYVLKNVPEKLFPMFQQLLSRYPHDRISIDQFIESDYFNGSVIKAMWFVDEFATKDLQEKLVFLRGISDTSDDSFLSQFPTPFKIQKMLPLLIDLVQREINVLNGKLPNNEVNELISLSLSIVFKIGSELSGLSFQDKIYSSLLQDDPKSRYFPNGFTKLCNASVRIRLELVSNIPVLAAKLNAKTSAAIVKELLPLSFTIPSNELHEQEAQTKLQESVLENLKFVISGLEFSYVKNTLFPLLCELFRATTILSTKLQSLKTFEMMISKRAVDDAIIKEQLLPLLQKMKSRDKRVVSQTLKFYVDLCFDSHISLDTEEIVGYVLHQCFLLAYGCSDCTKSEFRGYLASITKIENSLKEKKLQSLPDVAKKPNVPSEDKFETLISKQNINNEGLESPQISSFKTTIQPTKRGITPRQAKNGSDASQKAPPAKVKPLTLTPKHKQNNLASLSFGATSNNNGSATSKDEEFSSFQQNSDTLDNWSTQNKPTTTNRPTTNNKLHNIPPGFNSNIVLTPSVAGRKKTNSSASTFSDSLI